MAAGPLNSPAGATLNGATALWVLHHDYSGVGRIRVIPPSRFDEVMRDGVTFGLIAWDFTITGQLVPDPPYTLASGDYRVIPDPSTLTHMPHLDGVVQAMSDLHDADGRWDGDPRARLRLAWQELATLGYTVRVALESEFQVIRDTGADDWPPVERLPMFSVNAIESQWTSWMGRTLDTLLAAGVPVHQFAREGAVGQYECSLLPSDPVAACDAFLVARQIIKGTMPPGLVATFMPKPYSDRAGNGLHVHISISDANGVDVIADPSDPGALTALGVRIVSALVEHAPAQLALAAPTPNSYRRLVPGWGAPTRASWSIGNRSALVRIPGRGPGRRIEYRSGDQSCNPYLHVAGLLATISHAIRHERAPIAPINLDLSMLDEHELQESGARPLPRSVPEALDSLERDGVLAAALGPVILAHYPSSKREEHETYVRETAGGSSSVSAWERATYLLAL